MGVLFNQDTTQYQQQLKKYTALFGSLFADLHIERGNSLISVPIKYGPGFLRNKSSNQFSDDRIRAGLQLPALAFEMIDVKIDSSRMVSPYNRQSGDLVSSGAMTAEYSLAPTPHDIVYRLTIRSKNIEDGFQILEQIIGAFNPQVSIKMLDSKNLGFKRDISVYLDGGYDIQDNYENSQDELRFVEISLNFTLKGYIYSRTTTGHLITDISLVMQVGDELIETKAAQATDEQLAEIQQRQNLRHIDEVISTLNQCDT